MTKVWSPEQYDEFYRQSDEYKKPYQESLYFPIWKHVITRIPKNVIVLDIGCGTGQFAAALSARGILDIRGIDFSRVAVDMAHEATDHRYVVYVADITNLSAMGLEDYDYLTCLETLEHIEDDIAVLNQVRPGKHCLITVPNYDGPNHVRFFPTVESVEDRYMRFFSFWELTWYNLTSSQIIFLINGTRNRHN